MMISFIGGGNMASALIAGLAGKDIHVVDPNADALARLKAQYGVGTSGAIDAAVAGSDVIVLAVKPSKCAKWRRRCCRIWPTSSH
jgi:pyrroline-5-carboxylate reductase